MLHSDRLGGLVYLDALGDATDDPPDDSDVEGAPGEAAAVRAARPSARTIGRRSPRSAPPCSAVTALPSPKAISARASRRPRTEAWGPARSPGWVSRAIGTGRPARDYSKIKVPVLAISDAVDFDLSHLKPEQPQPRNDEERALLIAFGKATQAVFDRWSANLKRGVPDAKVVDMPGATHYLWMTREADVLREIRAFIAGLPPRR